MLDLLIPAAPADRPLLENLLQFYHYDFAEMLRMPVGADGRFPLPALDAYWTDPLRHPFLLRAEGYVAGFALVHQRSRLTGEEGVSDVAEFFVMRAHRRGGVGSRAAVALFDRFPGRWEVRQIPVNTAATDFWRRVIGAYTKGRYREALHDDARWRGTVQSFDTTPT